MATVASVTKDVVKSGIDKDYIAECGFKTLGEVFQREHGHVKLSDQSCTDYLKGLPIACHVPYQDADILNLIYSRGVDRVAPRGEAKLIDTYWNACGAHLHKLIRDGE